MFEKVLFPTDFSGHAERTFECIGEIPGVREIYLLHIIDATHPSKHGWTHGPHIVNSRIYLEEKKKYLEDLGLQVTAKVEVITEGDVYQTILDTAEKEQVSLILMSARGKNPLAGLLLGSVSAKVIRHAAASVLIMRYKLVEKLEGEKFEKFCPMIFSNVLFPTDFSAPAERALAGLKKIGCIRNLVLLNVVNKGESEEEITANVKNARESLAHIRDDLARTFFSVQEHVRVGDPPGQIISTAEDYDASLIALCPQGEGTLKKLLLGSTTSAVIRAASRPVLIMRPGNP